MNDRLLFPPELRCLGTRPHQVDSCRPLENCSAFTSLRKAAAISGPIPGIVISTLYLGCCWRRAAPTLCIRDPHKDEKMAAIHKALDECSAEHPVFYEDEVDIHLNPKIGADWQLRGHQKRIVTLGQNEKYYLAGALHSGTGKVSYVGGNSKSSSLFISLLKHLKATYRRAKTITLIVDNYIIHKSRKTQGWLKANPKFG